MCNNSRNYFSLKSAEKFAASLELAGAEDVEIVSFRDAFNQTQYSVRWNMYD